MGDNHRSGITKLERFDGLKLNRDFALSHFLQFSDYLDYNEIDHEPDSVAGVAQLVTIFKQTLKGDARLWIEGKIFRSLEDLRTQFIERFSEATTNFSLNQQFSQFTYNPDISPVENLEKLQKITTQLHMSENQVKHKFICILPNQCQQSIMLSSNDNTTLHEITQKTQIYFDITKTTTASKEVSFATTEPSFSGLEKEFKDLKCTVENISKTLEHNGKSTHVSRFDSDRHFDRHLDRSNSRDRYRQDRHNRSTSRDRDRYRHNRHRSTSRDRSLSQSYHGPTAPFTSNRPIAPKTTFTTNPSYYPMLFCQYCYKPNHTWKYCYIRQRDLQQHNMSIQKPHPEFNYAYPSQSSSNHAYSPQQSTSQTSHQQDFP